MDPQYAISKVSAKYENTVKHYKLNTPYRKKVVMSVVRRSYRSAAKKALAIDKMQLHTIAAVAQQVRSEMKKIRSLGHNSILRNSNATLKQFSWVRIWEEFQSNIPTLVKFMKCVLDFKLVTMLIAMILKSRCKHMSLVQQTFSVVLYGNATNKEVIDAI